jgi:Methyltransferase domain
MSPRLEKFVHLAQIALSRRTRSRAHRGEGVGPNHDRLGPIGLTPIPRGEAEPSTLGATRVVEFATSVGMSTLYFAAAVRDNGGGTVIGSELVPDKVAAARYNIAEAGLTDLVDLREGDARETLRDLGGQVDFVLIDGWPGRTGSSLARQVTEIVAAQLRIGGLLMNDNGEADYLDYVRDPANGFRSMSLPLKGGTELSVKVDR